GMKVLRGEERTNYPLVLSVEDLGEEVGLTVQAAEGVNAQRVCAYMEKALESLVQALEQEPERAGWSLAILPEAERRRLMEEWNGSRREYPRQQCVHELFEEQVRKTPDALAVVHGERQWTYAQLNHHANQLAHYLRSLGVRGESRVGICLERSIEMAVAMLAT